MGLFLDDGEGYIDLGLDNIYEYNEDRDMVADTGKIWLRHGISYGQINSVLPFVENRFGKLNAVVLDGNNSFLCFTTQNTHEQIDEFLEALDGAKNVSVITLRYIKTDDLLSHLPPGISSSQ